MGLSSRGTAVDARIPSRDGGRNTHGHSRVRGRGCSGGAKVVRVASYEADVLKETTCDGESHAAGAHVTGVSGGGGPAHPERIARKAAERQQSHGRYTQRP